MQTLRQLLRQQRHNINSFNRAKFSKNLLIQVQKLVNFHHLHKVAIYLANDGEIDTKHLQNLLNILQINIYLPILVGKSLKFAKVGKKFKKNKYGILEPIFTQILDAKQLDIIFMPLVGFDKNKNRIGMGGGFYDRTLAFKQQKVFKIPKLYGLAFDCQQVKKLQAQEWDIALDAIITPSKTY
jgi:5-formyltetrahydrofolate cyclo-ligase